MQNLAIEVGCRSVVDQVKEYLSPLQVGFGTRIGAEAAIHSIRSYLSEIPSDFVMVKLDFKNAFNSIRRDAVLKACLEHTPELYPLVFSCYSSCSHLFYDDHILLSQEGVQQGDPLGPLLFCLAVQPLVNKLQSELKIFCLDDGLAGGPIHDVIKDIWLVKEEAHLLGLVLNLKKSELIAINPHSPPMLSSVPDLNPVHLNEAIFLGAPIGGCASTDLAVFCKCKALRIMGDRLPHFKRHDSLLLLRHSFSIPKILYLLRTSPCFRSTKLVEFDEILRSITSDVLNVNLSDEMTWLQASLPVFSGSIGVRSAVQLAPSTFLALAAGCHALTKEILPPRFHSTSCPEVEEALELWRSHTSAEVPSSPSNSWQKAWDSPQVDARFQLLIKNSQDPTAQARLLGAASKESGAWLNAPPPPPPGILTGASHGG